MNPLRSALTLRSLQHHLYLSPQRLAEIQAEKLQALVGHAYAAIPYYRDLFDQAGIRPQDIRAPADLLRIPVTRRTQYRREPVARRLAPAALHQPMLVFPSGGSRGIPLHVHMTAAERSLHALYTLRAEHAVGARFHHRTALVSPRLRATPTQVGITPAQRWFERLGVLRKHHLDIWEPPAAQLAQLKRLRPEVVVSYPSHLCLLAEEVRRVGLGGWRPRLLFTNSEPLTVGARQRITETFGAPVFQCYDAWETHLIAWQCERGEALHINSDHVIVELLESDQPSQHGEVVVTNLDLFSMPILRYSLGDSAELEPEPCPCGRSLPRLRAIHGRLGDVARLADGSTFPMLGADMILSHMTGVAQYCLVQEEPNTFRVEVVAGEHFALAEVEQVVEWFRSHCNQPLTVTIKQVSEITPLPSGKRPHFVSKLE